MGAAQLIPPVIGTAFEVTKQYATLAGLKSIVGTSWLGMSMATKFLSVGVCVVLAISAGIYVYTRKNGSIVQQARSQVPLRDQQLRPEYQGSDAPKWQKISMSEKQFNSLITLCQETFKERKQHFICPFAMQIMREPCTMKCCNKLPNKTDRYADKYMLIHYIKTKKRCLLCQKPAQESDIVFDERLWDQIFDFRCRIFKTYQQLDQQQKQVWRELIDSQFGQRYTAQHLE